MAEDEQQQEQEALGGSWRQHFEDDPETLFNYTEEAYGELGAALEYVSSIADPELQVSCRLHAQGAGKDQDWDRDQAAHCGR